MPESSALRRAVIVAAPVALIVFSLAHGADWLVMHGMHDEDYDAFLEYIVQIRGRWLAVHVAGLALFPLLGVAVWWMLPRGRWASRLSRMGLAAYIVLYSAFDAIAGIGSSVAAEYRQGLPPDQRHAVTGRAIRQSQCAGSAVQGLDSDRSQSIPCQLNLRKKSRLASMTHILGTC